VNSAIFFLEGVPGVYFLEIKTDEGQKARVRVIKE
jgi:hypothetical protein